MRRKFLVALEILIPIFAKLIVIASGVAPNIDYSNNMRVLRLPKSTKNGTIIYRLKGTDPDPDVLTFGVEGEEANNLLLIKAASFTEADVILKSSLEKEKYFFTAYVTDGKEITRTDASIVVTNPETVLSPFLDVPPVIIVPENTPTNASIGFILAKEMDDSNLAVKFEIKGSDSFAIRYVFGPRGTSKAEILLVKPVDYERKNVYPLTILAMNAWKNETIDTRNVAVASVVIVVSDVQDTPPQFTSIPLVVQLSESQNPGDTVFKVKAEDFDFGNPRNLTYAIVQNKPWSSYFRIDATTGEVFLVRSVGVLRDQFSDSMPILITIKAKEIGPSFGFLAAEVSSDVAIVVINTENHPPKFEAPVFRGFIPENSPLMTSVTWEEGTVPKVKDPDQGANGTFLLYLDDVRGVFDVTPTKANGEVTFHVVVKYPSFLDYDVEEKEPITLQIVAKEAGTPQRFTATALIRIKVTDVNDNAPQFTQSRYEASVPEKVKAGTSVITIKATDKDSGLYGDVSYAIRGTMAKNFNIDSATGEITVLTDDGFDRERASEYILTVEARDERGSGNFNDTRLIIHLLDANDNAPVFTQPRYDAVLQSDCQSFYDQLVIRAYDADESGPNNNVSYEIINGNYQEKFIINNQTGIIRLKEPITKTPGSNGIPGIPPITLTVRAHDQGIPVQYASVKVHIHGEEYLNRTINFIVPFEEDYVKDRIVSIGKGLSEITGSPTNILSINKFNASEEKSLSMVEAWIAYPLTTTVNLTTIDIFLSRMLRKESRLEQEEETKRVPVAKYATVFWILIVLIVLIIIAIICCCCYFCCVRLIGNKLKKEMSKVTPQEKIIILKDQDGNDSVKNAWDDDNETWVYSNGRLLKKTQHAFTPGVETLTKEIDSRRYERSSPRSTRTREPLRIEDRPIYAGANLRIDPRYERGGAQSVETEYVLQDNRRGDGGRPAAGGYVVVRRNVEDFKTRKDVREREEIEVGPKRTEIMYIRSPPKESRYDRPYNEGFLPRSVSETDLYQSRQKANREDEAEQRSHSLNSSFQKGKPLQPNVRAVQPDSLRFSRHHRDEAPYGSYRDSETNRIRPQTENPGFGSEYQSNNRRNGPPYRANEPASYQRQGGARNSNTVTTLGTDPTRVSPAAFDRPETFFHSQPNVNEAAIRLMPAGNGGQFAFGQTKTYPDQRKDFVDYNGEYRGNYPNANFYDKNYPGTTPKEYNGPVASDYPVPVSKDYQRPDEYYLSNRKERFPNNLEYPINRSNARTDPGYPRDYQTSEMLKNQYNQSVSASVESNGQRTSNWGTEYRDQRQSYPNHSEREYADAVRYNNGDYPDSVPHGRQPPNQYGTNYLNAIRENTSSARRDDIGRSRETLHPSVRQDGVGRSGQLLHPSVRQDGVGRSGELLHPSVRQDGVGRSGETFQPSSREDDVGASRERVHPRARQDDIDFVHPSPRPDDIGRSREIIHPSASKDDIGRSGEIVHPSYGHDDVGRSRDVDDIGRSRELLHPSASKDDVSRSRDIVHPSYGHDDVGRSREVVHPSASKDDVGRSRDIVHPSASKDDVGRSRDIVHPSYGHDDVRRSREVVHPSSEHDDVGRSREIVHPSARPDGTGRSAETFDPSAIREDIGRSREIIHPSARRDGVGRSGETFQRSARSGDIDSSRGTFHPSPRQEDVDRTRESYDASPKEDDVGRSRDSFDSNAKDVDGRSRESLDASARRTRDRAVESVHPNLDPVQIVVLNPNKDTRESTGSRRNRGVARRDSPPRSGINRASGTPVIRNQPGTPKERYSTPLDHIEQYLAPSNDGSRTSPIFDTGKFLERSGNNLCDESKLEKRAIIENRDGHVFIIETDRPILDNDTTTNEEDSDSGIGGHSLRLKKGSYLEKKSVFTIAYDGMQTQKLKSSEGRRISP